MIDDDLVRAVGREVLRLSRRRVLTPAGAELDQSVFRILWAVAEHGPLSMRELEHELQVEQSTVSRQVKGAVALGLVELEATTGRRERLVRLTQAGRDAYERDGALRLAIFRETLSGLGRERVESLVRDLADLNDAIERTYSVSEGPRPPQPGG
ncbi:DNA-binding MarR family transcriptional regulator [Nocardioides thalensis]|uniref:DNA-binding MarR family transcriptional regulator n=1 Tax=Nocardioides thalensis TaxID=1914755 RepID=A0A853C7T4_9ACTN|nr:MarR family winged helix-turn-helix transcriptional regulator [Nocardioides thalensis]NYJ03211.1 DNA-binding MarR family transcriptional regulator [Nocardioides thalensis]